jgi:protein SCO1/2
MTVLKAVRIAAWSLVAVSAVAFPLYYLAGDRLFQTPSNAQRMLGRASIGGPFELTDHEGKRVTEASLRGRPFLVFFGFTHCPDVCPTAMFELSEAFRAAGSAADDVTAFFVSVDPERDTPELLKTYLSSFDPRIRALFGPSEAIDAMVRSYRAFYRKVPLDKGSYTIDHTALIYLMGRDGQFVDLIRPNETLDARVRKIRELARTR